jgi:hypothetical protein
MPAKSAAGQPLINLQMNTETKSGQFRDGIGARLPIAARLHVVLPPRLQVVPGECGALIRGDA